jgi:hypothetical protein
VPDPFVDSRLIVADARGWKVVAPATEAMSIEPCDGLCPTGMWPVASLDGQTVFYVETTPVLEDLSVADPGWSLWRWDRAEDSVARVAGCGPTLCTMGPPSPSPDGRHVAYLELPSPAPEPPKPPNGVVVAVVDAVTGRTIVRTPVRWIAPPSWDSDSRLLMTTCAGPCRPDDRQYLRVGLTTGRVEEVGADLPRGNLMSSSDGQTILIDVTDYATWDPGTVQVLVADQALTTARPAFAIDDLSWWGRLAWGPNRTGFAIVVTKHPPPPTWGGEVLTYDLSSGAMTSLGDHGLMESSLLWLPDD